MLLEGKTVLVTGASRGIGKAIALDLVRNGATVLGTATSEKGAQAITDYLKEANATGKGYMLNVTNADSIEQLLKQIREEYADPDVLINNAAITQDNLLLRMKEDEWDSVITTNLNSIYRMSKACIRGMMKKRWGRIINIGSIVGTSGNLGQTNYAAAKAGIIGFSKSLAIEIASRNITVNVVAPGFVNTDMTKELPEEQQEWLLKQIPMQRIADPEEIAHAVTFLASDQANYITGQTIHVNGGMLMP
ncbi:MAG: 3-oxoacyl-ACP reductase FabG [Gammaproteobacteria bacterium]